jgi:hypothetical protein
VRRLAAAALAGGLAVFPAAATAKPTPLRVVRRT